MMDDDVSRDSERKKKLKVWKQKEQIIRKEKLWGDEWQAAKLQTLGEIKRTHRNASGWKQ